MLYLFLKVGIHYCPYGKFEPALLSKSGKTGIFQQNVRLKIVTGGKRDLHVWQSSRVKSSGCLISLLTIHLENHV